MLANGAPLVSVSKILGHSSPEIPGQIYAHAPDEPKTEAIAALSQQLWPNAAPIPYPPKKEPRAP
jgi:integrase